MPSQAYSKHLQHLCIAVLTVRMETTIPFCCAAMGARCCGPLHPLTAPNNRTTSAIKDSVAHIMLERIAESNYVLCAFSENCEIIGTMVDSGDHTQSIISSTHHHERMFIPCGRQADKPMSTLYGIPK